MERMRDSGRKIFKQKYFMIVASITVVLTFFSTRISKYNTSNSFHVYSAKNAIKTPARTVDKSIEKKEEIEPKPVKKEVVNSINEFGFKLFKKSVEKDVTKNIFISPPSISFSLTLASLGANGRTKYELRKGLGLTSFKEEEISDEFKILLDNESYLPKDNELIIANSIWLKEDFNIKDDFQNKCKKYFYAKIGTFSSSPNPLNEWIEERTKGLIKNAIDNIDSSKLIFINTVYFECDWMSKFDREKTQQAKFYSSDGEIKMHEQMVSESLILKYFRGRNYEMIEYPYRNHRFSFFIFLPDSTSDLKKLYKDFRNNIIEGLGNANYPSKLNKDFFTKHGMRKFEEIELMMPKLKFDYSLNNLEDILITLGIKKVFFNNADLKKLSNNKLFIDKIIHKAVIEINEERTKAAATTDEIYMLADRNIYVFNVNRPYFFLIRDNKTNLILFMGSVAEPVIQE